MAEGMDPFDGFAEFFAARRQALSRAALFLTGDLAAAEELFQEAMARTAARWSSVSSTRDPEAYVRTVMINQVRNEWRKAKLANRFGWRLSQTESTDRRAQADESITFRDALLALTPGQRTVLYLRYYLDFTEAQTAAELGCSVGTVKSQNHKAIQALRSSAPRLLGATVESGSE